jgi:hypothetical protein
MKRIRYEGIFHWRILDLANSDIKSNEFLLTTGPTMIGEHEQLQFHMTREALIDLKSKIQDALE